MKNSMVILCASFVSLNIALNGAKGLPRDSTIDVSDRSLTTSDPNFQSTHLEQKTDSQTGNARIQRSAEKVASAEKKNGPNGKSKGHHKGHHTHSPPNAGSTTPLPEPRPLNVVFGTPVQRQAMETLQNTHPANPDRFPSVLPVTLGLPATGLLAQQSFNNQKQAPLMPQSTVQMPLGSPTNMVTGSPMMQASLVPQQQSSVHVPPMLPTNVVTGLPTIPQTAMDLAKQQPIEYSQKTTPQMPAGTATTKGIQPVFQQKFTNSQKTAITRESMSGVDVTWTTIEKTTKVPSLKPAEIKTTKRA